MNIQFVEYRQRRQRPLSNCGVIEIGVRGIAQGDANGAEITRSYPYCWVLTLPASGAIMLQLSSV